MEAPIEPWRETGGLLILPEDLNAFEAGDDEIECKPEEGFVRIGVREDGK